MREIKFRGKRIDNGEWVYGSLDWERLADGVEYYIHTGINGKEFEEFYSVLPETIGEFTSLKDCKRTEEFPEGQEIYEGDLLLTPHEPCSMVAWCSCGWMPFLRDQQTEPRFYLGRAVEVIGNIHENETTA